MSKPNSAVVEQLKTVLATSYALYLQTQNFHWNVRGMHFHSLHELFQSQYEEYAEAVDVIAEHIRTLGEFAPGTFADFSSMSQLDQTPGDIDSQAMVETLVSQTEHLIGLLNQTAQMAGDESDLETEDLMIERLRAHQKHLWMLKSLLA